MPGDIPPKGGAEKTQQIVLKTENLDKKVRRGLIVTFAESVNVDNSSITPEELWNWVKYICQYCPHDSSEALCTRQEHPLEISNAQVQPTDEAKLKWIQECHDSPVAGHQGRAKTDNLLSRNHCWNSMRKDVDRYVHKCHACQQSHPMPGKTHRLLRPLEIPEQLWQDLGMDFIVGLPESEGFHAIWVVVDRLIKMRHLVPCTDTVDGKKLGEIFIKEGFRLHGLPETIVSDRGPQFESEFWRHICE
jgi:hypothetical protein